MHMFTYAAMCVSHMGLRLHFDRWEAGNNRKLEVPAEAGLVALAVDCVWCSTTDMVPAGEWAQSCCSSLDEMILRVSCVHGHINCYSAHR